MNKFILFGFITLLSLQVLLSVNTTSELVGSDEKINHLDIIQHENLVTFIWRTRERTPGERHHRHRDDTASFSYNCTTTYYCKTLDRRNEQAKEFIERSSIKLTEKRKNLLRDHKIYVD